MIFIGVDPGRTGAIAMLDENGKIIQVHDIKKGVEFYKFLKAITFDCVVTIEQIITMKRDGHTNSFNNGFNYGQYLMAVDSLNEQFKRYELITIHPATWKADFKLSKDKSLSKNLCVNIFGEEVLEYITGKKGAFLDGNAEALLIAYWGKLKYNRRLMYAK